MKATFSQMSSPFITGVVETLTIKKKIQTKDLLSLFVCLFVCFCLFFCHSVIFIFSRLFSSFILFSSFKNKLNENFIALFPQDLKVT